MHVKLDIWVEVEDVEQLLAKAEEVAIRDWQQTFAFLYEDRCKSERVRHAVHLLFTTTSAWDFLHGVEAGDVQSEIYGYPAEWDEEDAPGDGNPHLGEVVTDHRI